jgi:aspartate/methionine/tyrosine aminotransferase
VDKYRVAGVPGSAFYEGLSSTGSVRFCFAVLDLELQRLADVLAG